MKKTLSVLISLTVILLISACSGSEKKESISEKIDRQTTEAAEKIEKKIRSPLQKARDTRKMGDRRLDEIDRGLDRQ